MPDDPIDHRTHEPPDPRSVVDARRQRHDPEVRAEAPRRTGLARFLERLGTLFQIHPRGPHGS
jgi:hypothetical protein